jgi:hypothetical protein
MANLLEKGHVAPEQVAGNERPTIDLYQRVPAAPPTSNACTG